MNLLDTDDDTLRDRMERSPEMVMPEVRRLQREVDRLKRLVGEDLGHRCESWDGGLCTDCGRRIDTLPGMARG